MPGSAAKAEEPGATAAEADGIPEGRGGRQGLRRLSHHPARCRYRRRRRGSCEFLDEGFHGTMEWLAETAERRADPRTLWSDVRSVVMFGMNYGPEEDPRGILDQPDRGGDLRLCPEPRLSRHHQGPPERGRDPLCGTCRRRREGVRRHGTGDGKAARRKGRHRLARQTHQSRQPRVRLLAVSRQPVHHGRTCLSTPPSATIAAPVVPVSTPVPPLPSRPPTSIDARRCISYLTIEHKGPIDPTLRPLIGNRIYGCDDCLAACPWNKFAQSRRRR